MCIAVVADIEDELDFEYEAVPVWVIVVDRDKVGDWELLRLGELVLVVVLVIVRDADDEADTR